MGILFFILKLIGKILLIILLLILLIILLVLFVPFRYRIDISKEGSGGGGTATVSWLLKMIQVTVGADIGMETGFKLIKDVKIFGISLFDLLGKIKGGKKPPEPGPAAAPSPENEPAPAETAAAEPVTTDTGSENAAPEEPAGEAPAAEETAGNTGEAEEEPGAEAQEENVSSGSSGAESEEEAQKPPEEPEPKTDPREVARVLGRQAAAFIKSIPERILNFTLTNSYRIMGLFVKLLFLIGTIIWQIFSLLFRIFGLPGQIESLRAAIVEKFWNIVRLIQKWAAFATDPQVHEAVGFLLDRVKKILGHVMPKKLSGHLEVGFTDPSVTGNVMAAYAAIYPLYLNDFELTPYFNETRFEGKADLRGRVYLFYLAYLAVTTILNKNIKYVISYLKHMKEEDS